MSLRKAVKRRSGAAEGAGVGSGFSDSLAGSIMGQLDLFRGMRAAATRTALPNREY